MFGRKKAPTEDEKAAMQAAMAERIRERFEEFDETVMMPFQEGLLLTFSEGLDQRVEEHGIVPEIIRKYYVEVCEAPWRDALPGFEYDFYAFRSEEHTSELQSLMRISYAVFCLTQKKTTTLSNKP